MKTQLKNGQKATGAQILCEMLTREGVDIIFGYPGGAIMPIYDALSQFPNLRHILVRHEQGAAHAAEGYARVSAKPGVCFATSGPGATNLVTGLADAMMDSIPLVCITGQVASHLIGGDAFQETDVVGVTTVITKHNYLITDPDDIAQTVKEAFHIARSGRPGPVVIDIAKDTQSKETIFRYPDTLDIPGYNPTRAGNMQQIKKAAQLINSSKKPLILSGHGILISQAEKELQLLSLRAHIPVSTTLHGIGTIPKDSPNYVGMLGMHGNVGPNKATNQADLLIALGMRFDDRVTGNLAYYGKQAKVIHIDIDPAELNKNVPADIPIVGDVKTVLTSLLPLVHRARHEEWFSFIRSFEKDEMEKVIQKEVYSSSGKIKMGEVIHTISTLTKGEATIVADVGQNQMFAARYYNYKRPNSYITSGGLGTMGFALPAGLGAKVADPKQEVWIVVGDGGFQMTMQEMMTIVSENIAVKIAILNNHFLGMVRQWQELFFDRNYSETRMKNPDFIMLAHAFGMKAQKVTKRQELKRAIVEARAYKGPYLLEFDVETEANVFPMMPAGAAVDDIRME